MGKGKKEHEDVIKFLETKYGKSPNCNLKYIYPKDWHKKWGFKERPLSCDFIVDTPSLKAIVDVIFAEAWMESLGKIIGYFYEIKIGRQDYELWIVTNCKGKVKKNNLGSRFQAKNNWSKEKYIEYYKSWYRQMKEMGFKVIEPELRSKLKFYDFNGKKLEEL